MDSELIKVLIVDDERIAREGLKHIIDWNSLGCCICGEAIDGYDAMEKVQIYRPDCVLLDIRMPGMSGIELMKKMRDAQYTGEFVMLSGFSDFTYAQDAMRYGASFYLTKPIDEDQLAAAIANVCDKICRKRTHSLSHQKYKEKAKETVLMNLFSQTVYDNSINYGDLDLFAPIYQVVLYESYLPFLSFYDFTDLLTVGNKEAVLFESITIDNRNIVLLKGDLVIQRFRDCLKHYGQEPEKGSPLYSIFLSYSEPFSNLSEVHRAYQQSLELLKRRFFCDENQHVICVDSLREVAGDEISLQELIGYDFGQSFINCIKSYNRSRLQTELELLKQSLCYCQTDVILMKHFLSDIFIQVKQDICRTYPEQEIPFANNTAIMELIEKKNYLYEIMRYFSEQFEMIIRAIGNNSSDSVMGDVLDYIQRNYAQPLRLEKIAPLFGYSSAYLGKLITQKTGENFHNYLDRVRVSVACKQLLTTDKKIYDISQQVGYCNTDYFHIKFKKIMGVSPNEYRREHQ